MKPVEPTRSTRVLGGFARSVAADPPFLPQPARQNTAKTQVAPNAKCNDFNLPSWLPYQPKCLRGRTWHLRLCHEPREILGPIHVVPQIAALHAQPAGARGTLGLFQSIRSRPRHSCEHVRMNAPAGNCVVSAIFTRP